MAAFRRRTRFATPVVLVAACSSTESAPKEKPYAGSAWSVRMQLDMRCRATRDGDVERSIECPPGMTGNTTFVVGELGAGACGIVPRGCSDANCVKIKTACPLPAGQEVVQKLAIVWVIEKRGDRCHAEEDEGEDACPPGVDCNPPEPRYVPCPRQAREDVPLRVAELPDATCAVVPDGCTHTRCVTDRVACPTDAAR